MSALIQLMDYLLHLNIYLPEWAATYGMWIYLILFVVIFCETGLIVTPFLPGDSLLFAAGSVAALSQQHLNIHCLVLTLLIAAILGDFVNYQVGAFLGEKIKTNWKNRFVRQKHIDSTMLFYERYGGLTLVLARFMPIIRTFAPFVAGIGQMRYIKFCCYNVIGASLWIIIFTYAGYLFGHIPFIQQNLFWLMLVIIAVSLLPAVIALFKKIRH